MAANVSLKLRSKLRPAAGRRESGIVEQANVEADPGAHSRESKRRLRHGQVVQKHDSGTTVSYDMVPIPAGDFTMGSPDSDPHHKKDEQPPHKVTSMRSGCRRTR